MAERAVTIRDVARTAGVSTATVSRVLNGATNVDPTLAEQVHRAVAETNFVPNSHGRALRRQESQTWAAIISDIENPFFTRMVSALESDAVRRGFSVMLCNSDEQMEREQTYIRAAVAQRMAGVVIAVASERDSDLSPLLVAKVPTVLVDRRLDGYVGDVIQTDNRLVGKLAAEHLVQRGFRRIACIALDSDISTTQDRLDGFREALDRSGRPVRVERTNVRPGDGRDAMNTILETEPDIDAVFAVNGPLTAGAYRVLHERGISMPSDIALMGVDDNTWTQMVSPSVTVIRQPVTEMGRLAAELISSRSRGPHRPPRHVVLKPQLVARGSTEA